VADDPDRLDTQTDEPPVDGVLGELLDRFELAYEYERDNRDEAEKDLQILAGATWDEDVRNQRTQDEQLCLSFPVLNQYVDQVIGDWRQNRVESIVRPADGMPEPPQFQISGNKELPAHEVWAGVLRSIRRGNGKLPAAVAHDTAFEHMVSCGFGHWRVLHEYDGGGFDRAIRIVPLRDQFSVYWDPAATEWDKSDANWAIVALDVPSKHFEDQYPDAANASDLPVPEHLIGWFGPTSAGDTVRLAEYFRVTPVKKTILRLTDGRVVDDDDAFRAVQDELASAGVTVHEDRIVQDRVIDWYKCTGMEILEGPIRWPGKYIPIVSVWGKEHAVGRGQVRYRSIVRYSRDAARMFDYMRTAGVEAMALAPRSPFVIGSSQIGNYADIWRTANTRNHGFLPYDDSENKSVPQRQQPGYPAQGYFAEAQSAREDIKASVGMYDASVGARSNETSGKAIMARQRESDVMSFAYIDNMGRALEYEARILLDLIPKLYTTQRVLRVLNEDGSHYAITVNQTIRDEQTGRDIVLNDLRAGQFDVSTDIGPSYTTRRVEAADAIMQFVQAVPAAGALTADIIAKVQDWPGAEQLAKRLRFLLPPEIREAEDSEQENAEPLPPQVTNMLKQAEQAMGEAQARVQELEAALQEAATKGQALEDQQSVVANKAALDKQAFDLGKRELALQYDERVLALTKELRGTQDATRKQQESQLAQVSQGLGGMVEQITVLAAGIQQLGQQITVTHESSAKAMTSAVQAVALASERMMSASERIAAYLSAPRTLQYDADGNPVGVEIDGVGARSLTRDDSGRPERLQ